MAKELTASYRSLEAGVALFAGTDEELIVTIFAADGVTPLNVATWALSWMVKAWASDPAALIEKTTGAGISVTGIYNADAALNTQRAIISIADTDTQALAGYYRHELKRQDPGCETVLAYGRLQITRALHHA